MLLTATFRLLYSSEAGFDRKLEAAEQLVGALLGSGTPDAVAEAAALPPLVAAHYLRSLVEWSCSALIKGGSADAGGKKAKKQQQQQQGSQAARLEPRCWAVLVSVLDCHSIPASQPLPAALLPAATAALQQAGQGQGPHGAQQAELLRQLACLLRLLAGKFADSFRPGIEHAAALAEASLTGHAAAQQTAGDSAQAWEAAACAAVRLLAAVAAGHPNQRKVWDAAVPRLLPLLAGAAFPADSAAAGGQLAGSCLQVLEAVLFSQQHVAPLAAAAAAEFVAALAEAQGCGNGSGAAAATAAQAAAVEEQDEAEEEMEVDEAADGGTSKQAQRGAAGGYAAQLFAALLRQVAARELPLKLLPWMAGCFCAALKQHHRLAETGAELTSQADRRSKAQRQQDEEGGEEGGTAGGGSSQRKPAGSSGLSMSADFHFWVAVLRTLPPHVDQQAEPELACTVRGVALLAGALRQHQLYRPTQDPAGQQRLLLQQLADTALTLAQQQHDGSAAAASAPAGVVPAALGVIQGILAVEHRVIQQQLPLLWPLLLQSPQAATATEAGSSNSANVAVAVACSLVAAFAELRQLEVLLRSLTDALLQPVPEALDAAPAEGAAAAAVLATTRFRSALSAAVQQLPSGQVPMLLRLVAEAARRLGSAAPASSLLAADLWCCCLASLHIALTTAAAAAAAAAALVAALAPLMLPLLSAAAAGEDGTASAKKERKQRRGQAAQAALLPALLRLYRHALLVHARCAGLHPQITPLPGQHEQPADGSSSAAGYFAPLLGDEGSTPDLAALLASPAASGSGDLRQALLHAAEQRVCVLHQQQRYLTRTCPVALLPEPGTEQAQQQAAQQARQEQQAQQQLQAVEAELQQLAGVLATAVAEAAAAADGSMLEALQLAAGVLPILQEWAPPAPVQQLLQACLRHAAAGGASSQSAQLCRSLLLSDDLVEQRQLAALLPAAAAAELGAALSAALGGAGEEDADGTAKKKRKKGKEEGPAPGSGGPASPHAAALLQQLGRLAKGKAVKSGSWAAAVEGSSASIAAAAADLGGGNSGGSKKRKQQAEAASAAGLEAVRRQLQLLAQLPLAHVQPEAAAGLAAVAVGSLLCCWEGTLGPGKMGRAASSALPASRACLQLLARLAGGSSSGSLEGQQQLLPVVLQAALTSTAAVAAAQGEEAGDTSLRCVAASAEHSQQVMQALCSAQLAAGDGSVQSTASQLSAQLQQQQGVQQWAGAVLVHGCLAACYAAAQQASRRATADILCSGSSANHEQQATAALIGSTAALLEPAVAAALPAAAEAAAAADGVGQAGLLAGSLYSCAALLLRLRCCDHPAAEAVEQAAAGGNGGVVGAMPAAFQSAAALLGQLASDQPGAATGAILVQPVLEFVAACCSITGRMRPAASSAHYASLLGLLLHLLGQQPVSSTVPPGRQTIPFAAAFPAAAAAAADGAGSSAARPFLLDALRELVAGSSSQQLLLPLRYVEAALPAAASSGSGASTALPLCELLLVLLEAASGGRQQRLLAQHGERVAGLLAGFISSAAYGSSQPPAQQQQLQQQALPAVKQLAAAILAAGKGGSPAGAAIGEEALVAPATPAVPAAAAAGAGAVVAPPAAEVTALCTALRALESLAARPKLFQLPAMAVSSMVASVAALWSAYAEQAGPAAGASALPGFCFRLDATRGAGLFSGSCHLVLALLRHRQQELRRCLPLVLQALRALLRFLVAAELSARLQQRLPGCAAPQAGQALQAHHWRVKCAELLASVLTELAGLKEAGVGRYCPHLLADYLVLAAAPPSGKSKALLRFHSPARALAVASGGGSSAATSAPAVEAAGPGASGAAGAQASTAAAEEEVLAGEPMGREAAAALRQGAYALYGACSPAEVQFLYASLAGSGGGNVRGGSAAVASWRAALAALKADFEKHHKYTGKV